MFRERDYSQLALVFGLPFYTFIAGIVFIFSARSLIQAPSQWGWLAKSLLSAISLLSLSSFIYLAYWFYEVIKMSRDKARK